MNNLPEYEADLDKLHIDIVFYKNIAEKLAQALKLTQNYCGSEMLPPVQGWAWFDALFAYYWWEDIVSYNDLISLMEEKKRTDEEERVINQL